MLLLIFLKFKDPLKRFTNADTKKHVGFFVDTPKSTLLIIFIGSIFFSLCYLFLCSPVASAEEFTNAPVDNSQLP